MKCDREECKWLEWDTYGQHKRECLLNQYRRMKLFDRIKDLGMKYPEVAYSLCSDSCVGCVDRYVPIGDFKDEYYEDTDWTKKELDADKLAKEEFKDDELVKNMYAELKTKHYSEKIAVLEHALDSYRKILNGED